MRWHGQQGGRRLGAVVLGLAFAGWLAGCATTSRIDWKSRIGTYSYDEAVKEMGPPDRKETLSDGVTVADWVMERGRVVATPMYPYGGYPYRWRRGPWYPGPYNIYDTPDQIVRLQFGADGKLREWRQVYQ